MRMEAPSLHRARKSPQVQALIQPIQHHPLKGTVLYIVVHSDENNDRNNEIKHCVHKTIQKFYNYAIITSFEKLIVYNN